MGPERKTLKDWTLRNTSRRIFHFHVMCSWKGRVQVGPSRNGLDRSKPPSPPRPCHPSDPAGRLRRWTAAPRPEERARARRWKRASSREWSGGPSRDSPLSGGTRLRKSDPSAKTLQEKYFISSTSVQGKLYQD